MKRDQNLKEVFSFFHAFHKNLLLDFESISTWVPVYRHLHRDERCSKNFFSSIFQFFIYFDVL